MGADKNPSLKLLRKSRGKTLVGLSIELGYSATFLNQIERGMSTITDEVARVLTNYYKVPIYPTQVPHRVEINRLSNENEALEKQVLGAYDELYQKAVVIVDGAKTKERYQAFAEAEYYAWHEAAIAIPWGITGRGPRVSVSNIVPYQAMKSSVGCVANKYKFMKVRKSAISRAEREELKNTWGLMDHEIDEVQKGNYEPWHFEEEELEEDDYYYEDDV